MSLAETWDRAWPSRDADGRTNQKLRRRPKAGDRPGCVESREARAVEPKAQMSERQASERRNAFRNHAKGERVKGRRRGFMKPDGRPCYSVWCGEVHDYLVGLAVSTGRIFPSYEQIAEAVGCGYRTAVNCVQQLAAGGWLEWDRRFIRVGTPGSAEPQVEQTSNYYRLKLPSAAGKLIDAWREARTARQAARAAAGQPDEAVNEAIAGLRAAEAAKRRQSHLISQLAGARTPDQVVHILTASMRLQATLDAIGAGVQRREASTGGGSMPEREFPEGSEAGSKI